MTDFGAFWRHNRIDLGLAACLLLLILAVYAPVRNFSYLNYDDPVYVTLNRHVTAGLTRDSVGWAFTTYESANWIPLTWISLMAVRQFYGLDAGPQHVANVLLHAASALLLFGLLMRLTGERLPSAIVAFLFALHPQHVQSVAWVTERKDVLSAFFWMLALWSYTLYARSRKAGPYALTLLLYCLGLMAKPMVVTLPLILVLLDFWPLKRVSTAAPRNLFTWRTARTLLLDKVPFLAIAMAMSAVTLLAQHSGEAVRPLDEWPLGRRLANAVVSGAMYVWKTIWPSHLAVYYPSHPEPGAWQAALAAVFLLTVTILALLAVRTRPYLAVGWLWYGIAVLPVIGIVQVGEQARADRYTYLPGIGLYIMVAWGGMELYERWPKARKAWAAGAILAGIACLIATSKQVSYWKNSHTLFEHALQVTDNNEIAHGCLGEALRSEGHYQEALEQYRAALAIDPHYVAALINYGSVLGMLGRTEEAIVPLTTAIRLKHDDPAAHHAYGLLLALQGNLRGALEQFEVSLLYQPDSVQALVELGKTQGNLGQIDEAIARFSEALKLDPDNADARAGLQKALALKNRR